MCGICGIAATPAAPPSHLSIERMCAAITHRGPDDEGVLLLDGVGLGSRRLSIIDLEGGHQPIANEDETLWIVFNGEIYNHPELRQELIAAGHRFRTRTDTEAIVHGYEQWGDGCVERLNGMFAFAIWDRRKRTLLLARDRVGIKPLYYAVEPRRLLFASELKSILTAPGVAPEVDPVALDDYLALEYVPSPRSIFKGIAKLPPGHILTWRQSDGGHRIDRYWDVDLSASEDSPDGRSLEEHAQGLRSVLKAAVRAELISDVPVGVFLSGGIDSSSVAATMAELSPGNVNSFSIGFSDPSFDESAHARRVASHLGLNHHEMTFEPDTLLALLPELHRSLDEPFADASILPTLLLSRFTRQHVKVALGGDGGDELFAGYPTLQAHRLARYYGLLPGFVRREIVPSVVDRLPVSTDNISLDFKLRRFVSGALLPVAERHATWLGAFGREERSRLLAPDLQEAIRAAGAPDTVAEHFARQHARDPLNQVLYLDMKLYLENDILVKVDRASMMASLEARVPLLNAKLIDYVLRLPISLKLRGLRSKFLLKHAMRDRLPADILHRSKKGFGIPLAKWFLGPLREPLLEALHPDRIKDDGFFRPEAVRQLLDDHLAGRRDNRKQLWTLFVFSRWYDTWVAAAPRPAEATI
ncbi:MAG TPA: asparagine synthase (glutamine-hydrolyzing) [Candidatus Dormibacteraeota bacterium]|nr:asparagine synthase (glutamine-hydrolyzing) [Candidatus Dormibacteraeota bacterium]